MTMRWRLAYLLVGIVLVGCTQDPNVKKQQYLQQGDRYYAEGKHNEAIIQLKNALQIDPRYGAAVKSLARAYRAKSWTADALRELRHAVELDPGDLSAHQDLAQLYLDAEAWDSALAEADAVHATAPESSAELYIRGAALQGKGRAREALDLLTKAKAAGPVSPELHNAVGNALSALGQLREAEQAYRAALALRAGYADASVGLALLFVREGKSSLADEMLQQAKTSSPHNPKIRLALSALRAGEGKRTEAIKELEDLPRQTWSARVALALGMLYLQTGQYEKAAATAKVFRDFTPARYVMGHALLGLNRPQEAVEQFQEFLKRAPDNVLGHFSLAVALRGAGRPTEAIRELQRIAKPMEKFADYHLEAARAYVVVGQFDAAEKSALAAVPLAPQSPQPYGTLGSIEMARGDLKKAEQMYAKALAIDPSFSAGRIALGNVYNAEKRPDEAVAEYENVLRATPHDARAVAAKVSTLVQQKRFDDALKFAQGSLATDAKNAQLITLVGSLYLSRNDAAKAETEFRRALQIDEKFVPARLYLARALVAGKKEQEAIKELQRIVAERSTNVPAAITLARLQARRANWSQAIAALEPAAKAYPDAREISLVLSDLYLNAGRHDDAIARLTPLVAAEPKLVPARMLLGLAELGRNNVGAAVTQFSEVNAINPTFVAGHYYLARALRARNDIPGAKREFEKVLELTPEALLVRIELAGLTGRAPETALLDQAATQLKRALEGDPENLEARGNLARVYLLRGQTREAEAEYGKILAAAPTLVSANIALAQIRRQQKRPDEAADLLKAAVRTDPTNIAANLLLASHYEEKGALESAVQHLEVVHRFAPSVDLKLRLASLYGRTGRPDEGLARVKEVVTAQPKLASGHLLAGQLYLQRRNWPQAIEALLTATRLDPQLAPAHQWLGSAYERSGDPGRAIAAYRQAQALDPKNPVILNNLAWIYANREQSLGDAMTLARSAYELTPNSAAVVDTLGFVHYRRKEYDKAEALFRKGVELDARLAPVHYHLGMTYYQMGKKDDAIAALKRSLQLDEKLPEAQEARRVLKELGAS